MNLSWKVVVSGMLVLGGLQAGCSKFEVLKTPTTLEAPYGVHMAGITPKEITLAWSAARVLTGKGRIAKYLVLRDGVQIGAVADGETKFTDSSVWPLTAYRYSIAAITTDGVEATSNDELNVTSLQDFLKDDSGGYLLDENGNRIIAR